MQIPSIHPLLPSPCEPTVRVGYPSFRRRCVARRAADDELGVEDHPARRPPRDPISSNSRRAISRPISSIGCRTLDERRLRRHGQRRVVEPDDGDVAGTDRPLDWIAATAPSAIRSDAAKTASSLRRAGQQPLHCAASAVRVNSATSTSRSSSGIARRGESTRDSRQGGRHRRPCPAARRSSRSPRRPVRRRCRTAFAAPPRLSTSTYVTPVLGRPPADDDRDPLSPQVRGQRVRAVQRHQQHAVGVAAGRGSGRRAARPTDPGA